MKKLLFGIIVIAVAASCNSRNSGPVDASNEAARNLAEHKAEVKNEKAEVSVCEEPVRSDDILSYQDKYSGGAKGKSGIKSAKAVGGGMGSAKRKIPAEISEKMNKKIQEMAKQAFIDLNCSGVVRVDFLIDQDLDEVYICELNTIPGSLSFYLWEPSGMDFTALNDRLIDLALKRHREANNLVLSYSDNILKGWRG